MRIRGLAGVVTVVLVVVALAAVVTVGVVLLRPTDDGQASAGEGRSSDGAGGDGVIPFADIDAQAWLEAKGAAAEELTLDSMAAYYKPISYACTAEATPMMVALEGMSEASARVDFRFVCPDHLDDLDAAYAQRDEATDSHDVACTTPPEQRTADQQELVDAVADPSCL